MSKQSQMVRKFERMTGIYNARQENEYRLPIKEPTMIATDKIPQEILKGVEWSTHRPIQKGGQHAGIPNYGVKLIHKEMGFEISTDAFRSQTQAKEFCWTVFELFLQEIKAI